MECHIDKVPAHVLIKIIAKIGRPKDVTQYASVSRRWRSICSSPELWGSVVFEGADRVSLKQLNYFVNSPYSHDVAHLSIEGYIIRRVEAGSQSTITNHVLNRMGRRMPRLKSLRLWNANICSLNIKSFPRGLETLSLEGCIIDCNFLASLSQRNVLPRLKHLDLNYVHNLSSYSSSFEAVLMKRGLETLQVRHCYRIDNRELSKTSGISSLKVLNLSEIASVNDSVLKALSRLQLTELYLAFTVVSDAGLFAYCKDGPRSLQLLDIRGCPRVTAASLYELQSNMRLKTVWISGRMKGADEARKDIGPPKILDEVDLKKMASAIDFNNYSAHFADVLEDRPDDDVVEDGNIPVQPGYLQ